MNTLVAKLGCCPRQLSATYLGLPLGASHKSMVVWDGVEERLHKKLAFWKRNLYLQRGEDNFDQEYLSKPSLYQMFLVRMPVVVAKRLKKL